MKRILLIISGSIAAYKGLEIIRRGLERGFEFTTILTAGGQQFITPLSAASLSGNPCYTELFSLTDETQMGHIRLSREHDVILVAPASADMLAKMVSGRCDDLASTVLLATDKPVMVAPAMNHKMWEHEATQRNIQQLIADHIHIIQPDSGSMACGETGTGRMAEVATILDYIEAHFTANKPLAGLKALVTAGPTFEPIDPVRFIGNRSSGKQGFAVAQTLADAGADVTLISGPVHLPTPMGVKRVDVQTADDMLAACASHLPADIFVGAAAVADWKPTLSSEQKIKKQSPLASFDLTLVANPDILSHIAHLKVGRPQLVVGFAAETENLIPFATEKLTRKGCDWIIANDVSAGCVFGQDDNTITLITPDETQSFGIMSKQAVATLLTEKIADYFSPSSPLPVGEG